MYTWRRGKLLVLSSSIWVLIWKAKFFILWSVIFLVNLQGKFELDHWEWKVKRLGECTLWTWERKGKMAKVLSRLKRWSGLASGLIRLLALTLLPRAKLSPCFAYASVSGRLVGLGVFTVVQPAALTNPSVRDERGVNSSMNMLACLIIEKPVQIDTAHGNEAKWPNSFAARVRDHGDERWPMEVTSNTCFSGGIKCPKDNTFQSSL